VHLVGFTIEITCTACFMAESIAPGRMSSANLFQISLPLAYPAMLMYDSGQCLSNGGKRTVAR